VWHLRVTIVAVETQHCLVCIVDFQAAVNSINPFSLAKEMQQWVPSSSLLSYEILRTAVNNTKLFRSSCNMPKFYPLLTKFGISQYIFFNAHDMKLHHYPAIRRGAGTCEQKEGQADGQI
jgi:hypothetical protein